MQMTEAECQWSVVSRQWFVVWEHPQTSVIPLHERTSDLSQSAAGRTWSNGHATDKSYGELASAAGKI